METELPSRVWWDMVLFSFHRSYQIGHQITCKVHTLHPVLHLLNHPRSQPISRAWLLHQDGLVSPLSKELYLPLSRYHHPPSSCCELPIFILLLLFPLHISLCFICSYTHLPVLVRFSRNQHLTFCSLFPASLSSSLHYFFPFVLIGLSKDGFKSLVIFYFLVSIFILSPSKPYM